LGRNAAASAPTAAATARIRSRPHVRPPEIETRVTTAIAQMTTAATINANHAARLRDSTSAAARMTEPMAPSRKPGFVRAESAAITTAGVPIAARCAMKLRLPNVPPGARFRLK
jgi:hypothetical protein